ncbi:MAG: class F sortase [Candidatus Curtissbacteria bacterium]
MKTFLRKQFDATHRRQLFVIIVIGSVLGLLFIYLSGSFYKTNTAVLQSQEQAEIGLPARLKIPTLKADAAIEHLGLTQEGAMDAPKGFENVAWFNLGPRPGDKGSAVIAGHRSWINGKAAVFDNLDKLRIGDKLQIITDKGKSVSFVVVKIRVYDSGADAPEVFASQDGIHLNLVASAGAWDNSKKSATKRLVVFTDAI